MICEISTVESRSHQTRQAHGVDRLAKQTSTAEALTLSGSLLSSMQGKLSRGTVFTTMQKFLSRSEGGQLLVTYAVTYSNRRSHTQSGIDTSALKCPSGPHAKRRPALANVALRSYLLPRRKNLNANGKSSKLAMHRRQQTETQHPTQKHE